MDAKQLDSSDCSDHNMDEQEEKDQPTWNGAARTVSKGVVSERKRRKKLNDELYTVPWFQKLARFFAVLFVIDVFYLLVLLFSLRCGPCTVILSQSRSITWCEVTLLFPSLTVLQPKPHLE